MLAIIAEVAVGIVGGTDALWSRQTRAALDELPDGIGGVGMHDGGAIRDGHAGEIVGAVIVETEVLQESAMGFHQTIGVVIEIAPVGGVPALFVDGIDGIGRALVGVAAGLPGMVDGGQTPVLPGFMIAKRELTPLLDTNYWI